MRQREFPFVSSQLHAEQAREVWQLVDAHGGIAQLAKRVAHADARDVAAGKVHTRKARLEELRTCEVAALEDQPAAQAKLREGRLAQVAPRERDALELGLCKPHVREVALREARAN